MFFGDCYCILGSCYVVTMCIFSVVARMFSDCHAFGVVTVVAWIMGVVSMLLPDGCEVAVGCKRFLPLWFWVVAKEYYCGAIKQTVSNSGSVDVIAQ